MRGKRLNILTIDNRCYRNSFSNVKLRYYEETTHLSASWGGNADIEFSAQSKIINRFISRGKEWYQQSINRQHTATHSACAHRKLCSKDKCMYGIHIGMQWDRLKRIKQPNSSGTRLVTSLTYMLMVTYISWLNRYYKLKVMGVSPFNNVSN